jgi:hypothetical protein
LLLQTVLALTQHGDTTPDRGGMLAKTEVDALQKGYKDLSVIYH